MYEYNAYLITGGTGFIGKAIVNYLNANNAKIYIVTRQNKVSKQKNIEYIKWKPEENYFEKNIEEKNVCVIHLAGTNVASGRWTKNKKHEILQSRISSSAFLFELIKNKTIQASYVVSASAIGFYGEEEKIFTETDKHSNDFLGSTCFKWEQEINKIKTLDIPLGILRLGVVLGIEAGAFKEFLNTFKFRIAAVPTNGKQIYSWIHIDDVVKQFIYLSNQKHNDVFNAVAPNVCTATELLQTIGKYYCNNKFLKIHIPSFIFKIALGEFSIEILKSANVSSAKIQNLGFEYKYKNIDEACKNLCIK